LGAPLQPADDYEPEDLDHWEAIRVHRTLYRVAKLTHEQLSMVFFDIYHEIGLTQDEVQVNFAQILLEEAAGHPGPSGALTSASPDQLKSVALTVLANTGWTHVSEDVVEGFAGANGVDLVGLDDKIRRCDRRTEVVR
jgi:hypothetical protein